ncbi:MAG: efflux RND transporter periplasmic adaptor subunit [Caulobacterales bacterium]|nr:efflux RND transporter periplasmic adaptor subunit [Caulobacterales bacterium]
MGRFLFLGLVALVIAAGTGAAVWRINDNERRETAGRGGPRALPVTVAPAVEREFSDVVEALGTARARESITVTSRVTEVIGRLAFESGDAVAAGQVLAELTGAEEAADLREARATLEETQQEVERVEELRERGVVAQSLVDQAVAARDRALARVSAIEARLSDLIIRAPFDGVIGLRDVSVGALVRPGDPIATLDDVSLINVDFTVPELYLSALTPGAPIEVYAAAFPDETFSGEVAHLDSRVDPGTRSAAVRAEIANEDGRLRPGMLMLVDVRRERRRSVAIPALALVRRGEEAYVYVAAEREDRVAAERRSVIPGLRDGPFVEIREGLEPGERVVSEGVHRVRPNAPLRVVDDDAPAEAAPSDGNDGA